MKVHVKFASNMRKGSNIVDLWMHFQNNEVTVKEVLDKLEREKKIKVDLKDTSIIILVNGRRVEFVGGFDAKLK
ncbi:MAG: hypothetical protein QXX56_05960, partial [Candidatus Bathyarchaeia archaeon]